MNVILYFTDPVISIEISYIIGAAVGLISLATIVIIITVRRKRRSYTLPCRATASTDSVRRDLILRQRGTNLYDDLAAATFNNRATFDDYLPTQTSFAGAGHCIT